MSTLSDKMILYGCNTAIILWGFWSIRPERAISAARTVLAYGTLILLRLPLYFFVDLFQPAWLQSMVRFLPCVVFLRMAKGLDWRRCLYFSCLVWVGFTICSAVLRIPWLDGMTLGQLYYTVSGTARTAAVILRHGADFLVITWMTRYIPLNKIRSVGPERIGMLAFVIICELYIIQTLTAMEGAEWAADMPELTVYLVLLQVFVAAGVALFERYLIGNAERENMRLAELESRRRYEGLRARQSAESDVRRVHHDMKNHLLAIRRLSGDPQAQERYLDGLIHQEMAAMEGLVHTGNELLDGLLGEKLAQAEREGVSLRAELDFRPCAYVEDIDVCAIFGNVLDNAIEAAGKVEDPQQRSVLLKGAVAANQYLITCTNYYAGRLRLAGGLPVTTKTDRKHHGIGLSSVRRSVEKYGGVLTLDALQGQRLVVRILLPAERSQ